MFKTEPLKKFFEYMTERQNIWHRRFIEEKPPPWSENPVFQQLRFCNVYRQLDRGTHYVTEFIMSTDSKPEDILFRILLYRMFNDIDSYKALRPILNKFNGETAANILLERQKKGHKVFRNAWLTAGTGLHGPGSKIKDYCAVAESVYIGRRKFYSLINKTRNIREGCEAIRSVKWMGGFMGYQVALDYSYMDWLKWDEEDEWVYVGPGAKKGIYWLTGERPLTDHDLKDLEMEAKKPLDYEEAIRYLQQHQDAIFKKFGLEFKKWKGKQLDVHNVEFSLCEYNKMMRAAFGGRKNKYEFRGKNDMPGVL
jgi:hypothetical protein